MGQRCLARSEMAGDGGDGRHGMGYEAQDDLGVCLLTGLHEGSSDAAALGCAVGEPAGTGFSQQSAGIHSLFLFRA